MWVRGLKLSDNLFDYHPLYVAPYVGAWIETSAHLHNRMPWKSHPMWVRGLKQFFVLTVQSYKPKPRIIVLASNIPI